MSVSEIKRNNLVNVRKNLKETTKDLSLYPAGRAPIRLPENFIFLQEQLPEEPLLSQLIRAYQEVFAEEPWYETWSREEIVEKLKKELGSNSFLTLMVKKDEAVTGFSWGAVLSVRGLEQHIAKALGRYPQGLEEFLLNRQIERIVYFHEFAIIRKFRKGIEPVRFLLQPGLELGYEAGVFSTLFWSTPRSKIVPLAPLMGYEALPLELNKEDKEIVFLFLPDFRYLLKIAQNKKNGAVILIMRHSFRLLNQRAG